MREDEKRMFGMSKEDIEEQYINSLTARLSGLEMVVASILSDCQEINNSFYESKEEQIRQQLNIAKYILFQMMDQRKETV